MTLQLKLYNSYTNKKEIFIPINHNVINMYVCGPTLYGELHMGNMRSLVVFDVLYRVLKSIYPKVKYVCNITDIDDKIINKAQQEGITCQQLVDSYLKIYRANLKAFNILPPTEQPQVTDHIDVIVEIIQSLLSNGFAYKKDGHIFFSISKFNSYGALSKKLISSNIAGLGHGDLANSVKNAKQDFVLWKPSNKGQPSWDTAIGIGRPGWHIECSAMAYKYLGPTIDIHGGGQDLIFPHHENERAQTMAAFGVNHMANYWVHNGFVLYNGEKMSKSAGNVVTVDEALKDYEPNVLRVAMLTSHYRSTVHFTPETLKQASSIVSKLKRLVLGFKNSKAFSINKLSILDRGLQKEGSATFSVTFIDFCKALLDDLNTSLAITRMLGVHLDSLSSVEQEQQGNELFYMLNLLGINYDSWMNTEEDISDELISKFLLQRDEAKKNKNYQLADQIRLKLENLGVLLQDTPDGTKWYRK